MPKTSIPTLKSFEARFRVTTLLAVTMVICSVFTFVLTARELVAAVRKQAVEGEAQKLNVEVQNQSGTPLSITSINVTSSDATQPVFTYEVINTKEQPISAYAIRHDVIIGTAQTSGVTFSSRWTGNSLLYPQTASAEEFGSTTYGAPVNKVILSVDFVEFADGHTWGSDTFKMSEKLAGKRVGGETALEMLRGKSKMLGLNAVAEAIEEEISLTAEKDKSELWQEGFAEGVKIVRLRLKHAKSKGGLPTLKEELHRPFDISKARKPQ